MSFLAAVPVLGQALESVMGGLDKLFTSDDERLKGQHAILMAFQPVILLLVQAQADFDKVRMDLEKAALQSEDWFVRRSRPAMSWLTFFMWAYAFIVNHPRVEEAFAAFAIISGIWSVTRGGEKIVGKWVEHKNGNGSK